MYYCETSNDSIPHRTKFSRQTKYAMHRRVKQSMTLLKAMVTPETTPMMAAGAPENIWFGAAKTLFWIANALIIGIIVAKVCN